MERVVRANRLAGLLLDEVVRARLKHVKFTLGPHVTFWFVRDLQKNMKQHMRVFFGSYHFIPRQHFSERNLKGYKNSMQIVIYKFLTKHIGIVEGI